LAVCERSHTINYQLSTINYQLSTITYTYTYTYTYTSDYTHRQITDGGISKFPQGLKA